MIEMHIPFDFPPKIILLVDFVKQMASRNRVEILGEIVPTTSKTGDLVCGFLTR